MSLLLSLFIPASSQSDRHVVSVSKPSWQVAFDGDKQLGATTRVEFVKSSLASGQRLYSEHFPFPGVGKIVKGKDGASWLPESLN